MALRFVLAFFFGVAVALVGPAWAEYPPKVGQPHPDFTLPRIDNGQLVSLSDFSGTKVLLVHFASW